MRLSLLLRELRRLELVHRSGWQARDNAGRHAEVFTAGAGTDKPRPKRMSDHEKQAKYRARRKARQVGTAVSMALAGRGTLPRHGMKQYQLLGAGAGVSSLSTPKKPVFAEAA